MFNLRFCKQYVYVVWAYRYAELTEHNYLVAVSDKPNLAKKFADDERLRRGGKYECIVYKTKLNNPKFETWKMRIFYKTTEDFYEHDCKI